MTKKAVKVKEKNGGRMNKKLKAVKKNPKKVSEVEKNVGALKVTRPSAQRHFERIKFKNWKKKIAHPKKDIPLDGNKNVINNKENEDGNKDEKKEFPHPETLVDKNNIIGAVTGLRKLLSQKKDVNKEGFKNLLDDEMDDAHIFLQIICLKLPRPNKEGKVRPITLKIPFPHSLVDDSTEVVLITPDIERGLNVDHENTLYKYKDLLLEHGAVGLVNEIIPLRQLKVEYKEYEAKRNLANRVDVVLCDASVIRMVPMFLGKEFYGKKKHPIQVDLKAKDVSKEIKQALSQGQLHLTSQGTTSNIKVGRQGMADEEITANILSVVSKLCQHFPGGWENIQRLSIKTTTSKSVPVYASFNSLNSVPEPVIPDLPKREDAEGTINVLHDLKVRVTAEGEVHVVDKRLKNGLKSKPAKKYKPKVSHSGVFLEQEDNLSDVEDHELKDKKDKNRKKKYGKMTKTKAAFMEKLKQKRRVEFARKTGDPIKYPKNYKGPKVTIKKGAKGKFKKGPKATVNKDPKATDISGRNKGKDGKKVRAKKVAKKI